MTTIKRCNQYDLFNIDASIGQIYFCTDTKVLFKDYGTTKESRERFNANILYTEDERLKDIRPVIGKYYYVEESNCLYFFDTRWQLKIGDNSKYNSYSLDNNYLSPVINEDISITNKYGDKIIDNNGLLGNGAVCIRDTNRIIKGVMSVNDSTQELKISSYLNNGLLFIPNAHLPYNDLSTSYGALHLTVDSNLDLSDNSGQAHYYGNWNNYGDMYIIKSIEKNDDIYLTNELNNFNNQLIKLIISCNKVNENDENIKTYFNIRITNKIKNNINAQFNMIAEIISVKEDDNEANSIINDNGEIIYSSSSLVNYEIINGFLYYNETTSGNNIKFDFYFKNENISTNNPDISILESTDDNHEKYINSINKIYYDSNKNTNLNIYKYNKDKVITQNDLNSKIEELQKQINKLSNS